MRQHFIQLHSILATRFDEEELHTLCFSLGVRYDDLPAQGTAHKARELVEYLDRRGQVPKLIEIGKKQRPDILWEDILGSGRGVSSSQDTPPKWLLPTDGTEHGTPISVFASGVYGRLQETGMSALGSGNSLFSPRKVFVGRKNELSKLSSFARKSPMVGIYGQPGIGKTALAIEWITSKSQDMQKKTFCVIISANLTCEEIVAKLLLDLGEPRDFASAEEKRHVLIQTMSFSPALLLFDNCEVLSEAELEKLEKLVRELARAGCICILTSRKKFISEHIIGFELVPLSMDDAKSMLRARAEDYDVRNLEESEVETLCRRVENLPLAIEMLAPVIASKPISSIVQDIDAGHIDPLGRLVAAFEISYQNLPSEETKRLLRFLSVVPKDFSAEIATEIATELNICSREYINRGLYELTSRCLLSLTSVNRYTMHAMTRTYALSKLEESEKTEVEDKLIEIYVRLGKLADLWNITDGKNEQWQKTRHLFQCESPNIAILIETLIQRKDKRAVPLIVANADALIRVAKRGFLREAIERVLEFFGKFLLPKDLCRLNAYLGSILHRQRDLAAAEKALHKSLDYCQCEQVADWRFAGFSCIWLGWVCIENKKEEPDENKRRETAMAWYRAAYDIADKHNDELIRTYALHHFGHDAHWRARNSTSNERQALAKKARAIYEEVVERAISLNAYDRLCRVHSALAKLALNENDHLTASHHARESERIAQEISDERSIAVAKGIYAACLLAEAKNRKQSNFETEANNLAEKAKTLAVEGLSLLQKLGDRGTSWHMYNAIGDISAFSGEWEDTIWAYSNAIETHVTSSGSADIAEIRRKMEDAIDNQRECFRASYDRTYSAGEKALLHQDILNGNHENMENYDKVGLTLVWGLPIEQNIQSVAENAISFVASEQQAGFVARETSRLHATVLTMKKVNSEQSLTAESEWPFGIEKALQDLIRQLEIQREFGVFFKGLTISPRGEVLLCGFPRDEGLSRLRGDLKNSGFWVPKPWHKGNFHISLGYFRRSLSSIEEVMNLHRLLEAFENQETPAVINSLKLVHFRDRSLRNCLGSIELPLGRPTSLSSKHILQYLQLPLL